MDGNAGVAIASVWESTPLMASRRMDDALLEAVYERGILGGVKADAHELTDEEMAVLLRAAAEDEREGHLVRCASESELREFFAGFSRDDG